MKMIVALAFLLIASNSFAQEKQRKEGPCEQIKATCEKAGFVNRKAKEGYGLWADCVDPIMRGTPQPKKANKPLPTVGSDLVSACKAKRPNFGQGTRKAPRKQG